MIMRMFLVIGLILLGGTGYFIVVQTPPNVQAAPAVGDIERLREEGIFPEGVMFEDEEIEHDIFGVPPEDEAMIEAAMENMDMGGMNMAEGETMDMGTDGGMNMAEGETMDMGEGGQTDMADGRVLDMDMDGDGVMDMSSAEMAAGGGMNMAEGETMEMGEGGQTDMADGRVLDMDMDGDGVMDMSSAEMAAGGGMNMAEGETMDMGEGDEEHAEDSEAAEEEADRIMAGQMAGLMISDDGTFDREITLSMSEWTFSDLEVDAKPGEKIRFTLRNDGNILHEFMFMGMAQMQGVNYRARRADWNLLEHEALFEKSLVLPGEEFTFVAEVLRPGAWMFMCMLPYHMQMGMMGQLATEGMAMDMEM